MKIRIDPLDTIVSEYIRKRAIVRVGGCERCNAPKYDIQKEDGSIFPAWKQLHCAHYHGRRKKSTRWDEDNCSGLCFGCHQYFHENYDEFTEWLKQRLGEEEFDLLNSRARTPARFIDKNLLWIYYKNKIAEVSE